MMKKIYVLIAAVLLNQVTAISEACAQEYVEVAQAETFTVEQYATGEVVVTGSLTEMLIDDNPAALSVITSEDMQNMGVSNAYEALARVPGVSTTTGAEDGRVGIRGSSENEVLYLLNGNPLAAAPDATGRGETAQWLFQVLSVESIERIEVLRGPAGALYGAEAATGVINVITKRADEREITFGVIGGNYGINSYVNVDLGQMGPWDAFFSAGYSYDFAVRDEYVGAGGIFPEDAFYDSPEGPIANFMLDMGYRINDNHELRLFADLAYESLTSRSLFYKLDEYGALNSNSTSNHSVRDNFRFNANLTYNGTVGNHDYSISAGYNRINRDQYDRIKNSGTAETEEIDLVELTDSYYIDLLSFNIRDTWYINDWNTLTVGGSYRHRENSSVELSPIWSQNGVDYTNEYAIYVQDEISLFDGDLLLLPALRYDKYSLFDGQLSPSFGITYHINDDHRLKFSFGSSFLPPSPERIFGDGSKIMPSLDLRPERSYGFDLRYEGELDTDFGLFSGAVSVFYTDYQDKFERIILDLTNKEFQWQNAHAATNRGVELELNYTFLDDFTLSGSYTHADFVNHDTGYHLAGSYRNLYTAGLSYYNSDWDFSASLFVKFVDNQAVKEEKDDSDVGSTQGVYYTDYSSVDISLRKTWLDKYSLSFSVINLFNDVDAYNYRFVDPTTYTLGFEMSF